MRDAMTAQSKAGDQQYAGLNEQYAKLGVQYARLGEQFCQAAVRRRRPRRAARPFIASTAVFLHQQFG